MKPRRAPFVWLLTLAALPACHSSSKPKATSVAPPDAALATTTTDASASPTPFVSVTTDAVFSAPIAAARRGRTVFVGGLLARDGVVRVMALADGRTLWSTDVLHGVVWTPNAELTIEPAGELTAVLFRSGIGTSGAGKIVLLGPDGDLRGTPLDLHAAACTTSEGLAWVEPSPEGARILARAWSETAPRPLLKLVADQTPALACGDRTAFVLADSDENLAVTTFVPGDAAAHPAVVVMHDADFSDDERDHRAFTAGDTLVLVRVGDEGAVMLREVTATGTLGPWRRVKRALGDDDDIVAADGNGTTALVVYARDAEDACPSEGSMAQHVRARRIDRSTAAEVVFDVAPPDCGRSVGPFWVAPDGPAGNGVIAWPERRRHSEANAPPISGLAYRVVGETGVLSAGRIDIDADALATADCDREHCVVAALVRGGDPTDAMQPMAITLLAYP
jgi:hypothetical protein